MPLRHSSVPRHFGSDGQHGWYWYTPQVGGVGVGVGDEQYPPEQTRPETQRGFGESQQGVFCLPQVGFGGGSQ